MQPCTEPALSGLGAGALAIYADAAQW